MSVLLTADLHWNNLPRDKYRHDWQVELRSLVKKHRVEVAVIDGDLTDDKDFHPAQLVNKTVDHIYQLAQLCPVVVNLGNHDYTTVEATPFFAFLNRIDNVFWISKPTYGSLLPTTAPQDMLFLPHSPNVERDWKDIDFSQSSCVVAHQTFAGAVSEHGKELGGITYKFPKNVQVFSGDVHTPQTLDNGIVHIGAPYTVDFGDDYEPRVILLDGKGWKSIPCTGPQKRLVEIKAGELPKMKHLNEGDIVKVRVQLDTGQYAKWVEYKDRIKDWGYKNKLKIHLVQPVTKKLTTPKERTTRAFTPQSDSTVIKKFAERHSIDAHTLKVGLTIAEKS